MAADENETTRPVLGSPSISVAQGPTFPPGHELFAGGPSDADAVKADDVRSEADTREQAAGFADIDAKREEAPSPGTNSSGFSETPKKTPASRVIKK